MTVAPIIRTTEPSAGTVDQQDHLPMLLATAAARFKRCRARFETASARFELADRLASMGWSDLAAREATAALDMIAQLSIELGDRHGPSTASASRAVAEGMESLTRREQQVLALLAEGLTNRQIGKRLNVSEHTAHHHVAHILNKLGLPSRAAAAAHAVSTGRTGGLRVVPG